MDSEQELLAQTTAVAKEYAELAIRLRVTTGELISSMRTWDQDRVETLLQVRMDICDKISGYASEFEPLFERANQQAKRSDSLATNQVLTVIDQIFTLQNSLISQQSECEMVLSDQMASCKSELMGMNRRRGLNNAYSTSQPSGTARFLDKKL